MRLKKPRVRLPDMIVMDPLHFPQTRRSQGEQEKFRSGDVVRWMWGIASCL